MGEIVKAPVAEPETSGCLKTRYQRDRSQRHLRMLFDPARAGVCEPSIRENRTDPEPERRSDASGNKQRTPGSMNKSNPATGAGRRR